ncbi:uncharacterized protein Z518_00534 [Rhinocladiella mackenziei CBS 650.93]|uniref:Uncharacterized protein n=1 Tax=Rhinocladiella mackenziei CBS 650.93 TaxID=1442369 RepID=A0A0D2ITN4_9EURO|nr:uncharacterized protein Z518_00534 [Rhinocladiella mackenziei CBS 650.93]KIX09454.1 hypothetical protein Z518_00534 [Rhinocladiella mackenziei CBS 650.93]
MSPLQIQVYMSGLMRTVIANRHKIELLTSELLRTTQLPRARDAEIAQLREMLTAEDRMRDWVDAPAQAFANSEAVDPVKEKVSFDASPYQSNRQRRNGNDNEDKTDSRVPSFILRL